MKKFLMVLVAGALLVGCGTTEIEPVEETVQGGGEQQAEEVTEETTEEATNETTGYITSDEFIERAYEGKRYGAYATEMLSWVGTQEVRLMDTIDTDKEEYGSFKVDIVRVEDGYVAVAFDGEVLTGAWVFETVHDLRDEIQVSAE